MIAQLIAKHIEIHKGKSLIINDYILKRMINGILILSEIKGHNPIWKWTLKARYHILKIPIPREVNLEQDNVRLSIERKTLYLYERGKSKSWDRIIIPSYAVKNWIPS